MTKRHEAKYKIDRRMGQNIWGRPKSPVNHREYGPGQHGQRRKGKLSDYGVQLRAKQKLQGLLRQHLRAAVPRHLRGSHPHEGRHRREPDRPAGAPAGRHGLPRQVRADRVRRAPVRQPRPRQGERQARQHRRATASSPATSIEVKEKSKQLALVLEATGLAERDVPDYIDVDHTKMTAKFARIPALPKCPIRCRWSRTWSSSSIRADHVSPGRVTHKAGTAERPLLERSGRSANPAELGRK